MDNAANYARAAPVNEELSIPRQPFDPASEGWERYADEGFIGLIGPLWQRSEEGKTRYAFLAAPKHHNRRGVVQGGMLMAFADRSMGLTAFDANGRRPQATIQLDIQFIDAVQIGEFVEAHCEVVRRARSVIFMSGSLVAGDRTVARAQGVWKVLKSKEDGSAGARQEDHR